MKFAPFMTMERGNAAIYSYDGNRVTTLPEDWTGVVCDDTQVNSYWFIGRDYRSDERSFSKLGSSTYEHALLEGGVIDLRERLTASRSSPQEFLSAFAEYTNGDATALMQNFGPIKACTGYEAIRLFDAPATLNVDQKEYVYELVNGYDKLLESSNIKPVDVEAWTAFQDRQAQLLQMLSDDLGQRQTFQSLSATKHPLQHELRRAGVGWEIARFKDSSLLATTGYSDLKTALQDFLREVRSSELTVHSVPWQASDCAYYDQVSDSIYFLADCIERGREVPTMMRELCRFRSDRVMTPETKEQLLSQLQSWQSRPVGSSEHRVYFAAHKRATGFHGGAYEQHLMAYAVEEAAALGVVPSITADLESVEQWLAQVEGAVTRFFEHANVATEKLEMQDLVDFAYVMNALAHPTVGFEVRRILQQAQLEHEADAGQKGGGFPCNAKPLAEAIAEMRM